MQLDGNTAHDPQLSCCFVAFRRRQAILPYWSGYFIARGQVELRRFMMLFRDGSSPFVRAKLMIADGAPPITSGKFYP
uniref:Uncharacterized protein n=1 Tax=Ditylenchus dipsaci TaxID=166011 RepID=A0A915DP78_9BILA